MPFKDPEVAKAYQKKYREENKEKRNLYQKEYYAKARARDPTYNNEYFKLKQREKKYCNALNHLVGIFDN